MALLRKSAILSALALAYIASSAPARAEDLSSAPGWSLNKIQEQKADNDFSYGDARVYFSLKPPDQRPAITIDARSAERLRAGEVTAEGTYGGQSRPQQASKDEEYVYGNKANGIVVAEPVASTLTVADGRKEVVEPSEQTFERRGSSSGGGGVSLAGLSSGGSSSSSRSYGSSGASSPSRNSSASSAPPPNTTGASVPATGGGELPIQDPRRIAQAENSKPPDPVKGTYVGGINAANEAGGFAIKKKDKDGKEIKDKKSFEVVWPGGEPGKEGSKAHCLKSLYKVYDQPTIERVEIPAGCGTIAVKAWGAGGGMGGVDEGAGIGGGGAFVATSGAVDTQKFDVIVVIGGAGGDAKGGAAGAPGFVGGGGGGKTGGSTGGGGGGGGYSGVFLVDKGSKDDKSINAELAIAVAAGGGGGSATGESGTAGTGGKDSSGPDSGLTLQGGEGGDASGVNAAGGGGGGGMSGGAGGAASSTLDGKAGAGKGGTSFFRYLDDNEAVSGSGAKAGKSDHKDRNGAGDAGKHGRVILELY